MQIHQLKRKTKNKKPKSVGRGEKRGKTSGRGTKGQNARAGSRKRPELRDFIKKIPKLRGRGVNSQKSVKSKPVVVSLDKLEKNFSSGDAVNPSVLAEKGIIKKIGGKIPAVTLVSDGELTKKFEISKCKVTAKAREKIEKAGGEIGQPTTNN